MVISEFTENKVKGNIAETIVERMFIDGLGFYVLKLGQEHSANPLTQIERFITKCEGKFKLEREIKDGEGLDLLKKLPDFAIIHKNGKVRFLEVKYKCDGKLWDKDYNLFSIFPELILLVVNSEDSEGNKFNIWLNKEKQVTLNDWLKSEFDIESIELIKEYEALVEKWLNKRKK